MPRDWVQTRLVFATRSIYTDILTYILGVREETDQTFSESVGIDLPCELEVTVKNKVVISG